MAAEVKAGPTLSLPRPSIAGAAPSVVNTAPRLLMVHVSRRTSEALGPLAVEAGPNRRTALAGFATGALLQVARSSHLLGRIAPKRLPPWSGLPLALTLPPAVYTRLTTLAAERGMDVRHLAGWLVERALTEARPRTPVEQLLVKEAPISAAEAVWLRVERQRLGVSGRRVAQRVGCARSTVTACETGYRRNPAMAARIRDVLRTWATDQSE